MRNNRILTLILVLSCHLLWGQQRYHGLRASVSVPILTFEQDLGVKAGLGYGASYLYFVPYNKNIDMSIEVQGTFFSVKGNTRSYQMGAQTWTSIGDKKVGVMALDFVCSLLYGFGEYKAFKVGGGAFMGMYIASGADYHYWGTQTSPEQNYSLGGIFKSYNLGIAAETSYTFNDLLQLGLRYKYGLSNVYNTLNLEPSSLTMNHGCLDLSFTYFLGVSKRGHSSAKKKIDL